MRISAFSRQRQVSISSCLEFTRRTGRPDLRDRMAANGSSEQSNFRPNPPPTGGTVTLICDAGMPRTRAVTLRTVHGTCVDVSMW